MFSRLFKLQQSRNQWALETSGLLPPGFLDEEISFIHCYGCNTEQYCGMKEGSILCVIHDCLVDLEIDQLLIKTDQAESDADLIDIIQF